MHPPVFSVIPHSYNHFNFCSTNERSQSISLCNLSFSMCNISSSFWRTALSLHIFHALLSTWLLYCFSNVRCIASQPCISPVPLVNHSQLIPNRLQIFIMSFSIITPFPFIFLLNPPGAIPISFAKAFCDNSSISTSFSIHLLTFSVFISVFMYCVLFCFSLLNSY